MLGNPNWVPSGCYTQCPLALAIRTREIEPAGQHLLNRGTPAMVAFLVVSYLNQPGKKYPQN